MTNPNRQPEPTRLQPSHGSASASGQFSRAMLLRALSVAGLTVLFAGVVAGVVLFGGDNLLPPSALAYYVLGLGAAVFAAMFTVWLHGRFAAMPVPTGDPARTAYLASSRLQSLLASAFGVKLALVVLGVFALKQFPLGEEPAKFSEIATFAVTFAGASLLCQLGTAVVLARNLRRSQAPVQQGPVDRVAGESAVGREPTS